MAKKFFSRKDATVQKDLTELTYDEFFEKYKDQTTEAILKTVWNDAHKTSPKKGVTLPPPVELPGEIADIVDGPVILEKVSEFISEDNVEVKIKKTKKGSTVVETEDKKQKPSGKKIKEEDLEEDVKQTDKAESKSGRTPRMRELITELGKDKSAVRTKLEEEGFDVTGSGFHSEWHRVSKSIPDKE